MWVSLAPGPEISVAEQPGPVETPQIRRRAAWVDNLRVALIIGVIAAHVATAYIIDFDWYYMERGASGISEIVLWVIFGPGLLFGMGLLFLIAGLFTPFSFERKGAGRFVRGRLMRLGIPLVTFMVLIDPLTDFVGHHAMGEANGFIEYLDRWWHQDADLGPGWFIAALLVFSLAYAVWRTLRPAHGSQIDRLTVRQLVKAGALMAIASFLVRLRWPFGSDTVLRLNQWEFPQMITLFALGTLAAERGWLREGIPDRLRRRCGWAALGGAVMALLVGVSMNISGDEDSYLGGFHFEALAIPVIEAVIAIGMSLWMIEWFRRRWDHTGSFARGLGRASFAAYIIHPPVVVLISVAIRSLAAPIEVKFLVVFAIGAAASFALGFLLTRWSPVGRIV